MSLFSLLNVFDKLFGTIWLENKYNASAKNCKMKEQFFVECFYTEGFYEGFYTYFLAIC